MSKKYLLLFSLVSLFLFVLFIPKISKAEVNHIVISQIQIIGSTATDEFVELYNPTGEVVDLTGFRLSKKVSSGTQSNLIASMSGTINPNSYLLLGHTNYVGGIAKDKTYSTSSITNDNVVILYSDNGTTIVDKVGFGTPFESETLPYSINPTAGQSIRRINNIDTENNSVDFELLQVSDPRNSSFVSTTATPTTSPTGTPSPSPTPTIGPTEVPTETILPTNSPTPTITSTVTPTFSPSPSPTLKPVKDNDDDDNNHHEIHLPFGFRCKFERHEVEISKHHFKHFKFRFWRR